MKVLAMILSVVIAGTIVVGIYNKRPTGCRLCNEEHVHETEIVLDMNAFETNNR